MGLRPFGDFNSLHVDFPTVVLVQVPDLSLPYVLCSFCPLYAGRGLFIGMKPYSRTRLIPALDSPTPELTLPNLVSVESTEVSHLFVSYF